MSSSQILLPENEDITEDVLIPTLSSDFIEIQVEFFEADRFKQTVSVSSLCHRSSEVQFSAKVIALGAQEGVLES